MHSSRNSHNRSSSSRSRSTSRSTVSSRSSRTRNRRDISSSDITGSSSGTSSSCSSDGDDDSQRREFLLDEIPFDMLPIRMREYDARPENKIRLQSGQYHSQWKIFREDERGGFEKYMHMSKDTFDYILDHVKERLQKNWCNLHSRPIFPEERLVVTLRFFLNGTSYSDLGYAFCMGESTVRQIIDETVSAIWDTLVEKHMPQPTKESLKRTADEFYRRWGLPHCCGAIDGKHCRLRCPNNSGSIYFNFKGYFSIVLQAVVDAYYRFICIDVGGAGGQSDAGTFRASDFYACLEDGDIPMPDPDPLPGSDTDTPYFFIADAAYPLSANIQKAYPGQDLTPSQMRFNAYFNGVRKVVECGFGILAQKFRVFLGTIHQHPKLANKLIKCACLLHNIIINREKNVPAEVPAFRNAIENMEVGDINRDAGRMAFGGSGIEVREILREYVDRHRRRRQ